MNSVRRLAVIRQVRLAMDRRPHHAVRVRMMPFRQAAIHDAAHERGAVSLRPRGRAFRRVGFRLLDCPTVPFYRVRETVKIRHSHCAGIEPTTSRYGRVLWPTELAMRLSTR